LQFPRFGKYAYLRGGASDRRK